MSTNEGTERSAKAKYDIQKLLDEAVQPWDALTDAEIDALAKSIGRRNDPLAVPVVLSREGRLVDGSQRLRAMQLLGKKYVEAINVRIDERITNANALEWAIRLQTQRRQLDIPQKARVVRMLQAKNGWSQRRIATVFGVTHAAISQWLGQTPADTDIAIPAEVIGEDGVVQDVSAKRRQRLTQRTTPHPWSDKGNSFELVRKATSRIRGALDFPEPLNELSPEEHDAMVAILQDLEFTVRDLLASLDDTPSTRPQTRVRLAAAQGRPAEASVTLPVEEEVTEDDDEPAGNAELARSRQVSDECGRLTDALARTTSKRRTQPQLERARGFFKDLQAWRTDATAAAFDAVQQAIDEAAEAMGNLEYAESKEEKAEWRPAADDAWEELDTAAQELVSVFDEMTADAQ